MTDGQFLILLVGSNPLPNYLAACALRPGRVALVYTEETKEAKVRLKRELKAKLGESVVLEEPFIDDATCHTTVRRVLDPLIRAEDGRDVLLNYTGGTKVMAAHARMAFTEVHRRPEHASYLDEGGRDKSGLDHQPRLRFDNNTSQALSGYSDVGLDLKTLLALHGITHKPREPKAPAPTSDDAREILCKVLAHPPLAAALYCERERLEDREYSNPSTATAAPFVAERYGLRLSLPAFPTDALLNGLASRRDRESWFKQWYKFIGGEWLEEWLGEQIRALGLVPTPEITVGVNAYRGEKKAQLEVDVAVVRGHRSYFVSCTTDISKPICKSKLFEVAVRSRQLGGDLARAALVCHADDRTVSALQEDVDDVWGASNTTKVFGLSDIRAWSDCDGKQSNPDWLRAWLES